MNIISPYIIITSVVIIYIYGDKIYYHIKQKILQYTNLNIEQKKILNENKELIEYCNNHYSNISKTDNSYLKISRDLPNQYLIVNKNKIPTKIFNARETYNDIKIWIDTLLKYFIDLNIISIEDRNITINDLIIVDILSHHGSYYPRFHTDLEWEYFPGTLGFQIWYLVYNKTLDNTGNMFIYPHDQQDSKLTPSKLLLDYEEGMSVYSNTFSNRNCKIKIKSLDYIQDKFYYLNLEPGDCFIMNPNLWHSSCSRLKNQKDRKAINFRVIIKNIDGSISHNGSMLYRKLKHKFKDNKLYNVNRYDLM